MFSGVKVTTLYSLANDFCKEFEKYQENTSSLILQRKENIVTSSIVCVTLKKAILLGICTGISFVDSTPLFVCRNQRFHSLRDLQKVLDEHRHSSRRFFIFS